MYRFKCRSGCKVDAYRANCLCDVHGSIGFVVIAVHDIVVGRNRSFLLGHTFLGKTHIRFALHEFHISQANLAILSAKSERTRRAASCVATGNSSVWKQSTITSMLWFRISRSVSSDNLRRSMTEGMGGGANSGEKRSIPWITLPTCGATAVLTESLLTTSSVRANAACTRTGNWASSNKVMTALYWIARF